MKYLKKYKYQLTIIIAIIVIAYILIVKLMLYNNKNVAIETETSIEKTMKIDEENKNCNIDIKGAVVNPGVYLVDCTKNVSDVISIAGGMTTTADTSTINLAKRVYDEMVIIIYTKEEISNALAEKNTPTVIEKECICPEIKNDACIDKSSENAINTLININTATKSELETIPGIGSSKAESIIKYRKEHGEFKDISELKNVNGIGDKLYEEIKIYLTR